MARACFAFLVALLVALGAAAGPGLTQTSEVRGVTVAVTPGNVGPGSTVWDFAVAFHSARGVRLTDDVMQTVVLAADGEQVRPLSWEGARAGGTHRAGVLRFPALQPRPKELELRIERPGEPRPRVYRFSFPDWSA